MLKIFGQGNLLKDPDLKEVGEGKKVCNFAVASNRPGKEQPDIINVEVWGVIAENCAKYLKTGSGVAISGDYDYSTYESDGVKRFAIKCVNTEVQFTDKKPTGDK